MPIQSGSKFGAEFKNIFTGTIYSDKKYNLTYFLILNDGKNYNAYLMMIMADPAYVNDDFTKLAHNTYRKHDADFSGLVLYFTPKGRYIGGYKYVNGQLLTSSTSQSSGSKQVQDVKTDKVAVQTNCYDYYLTTFYDDGTTSTQYLGTLCDGPCNQSIQANGCPTGGSTPGGGSGNPPPPPPTCGGGTINQSIGGTTVDTINVADGGMPQPNDACAPDNSSKGIFGLKNANAVIPLENFEDFKTFWKNNDPPYNFPLQTQGYLIVNGVSYSGMWQQMLDAAGNVVTQFFTPDTSSPLFQTGFQYCIADNGNANTPPENMVTPSDYPNLGPPIYVSNSQIIYNANAPTNYNEIDIESDPNITDDTDAGLWDDDSDSYATQTLPSWANMNANYPKNSSGGDLPGPDVYSLVGGQVLAMYTSNPSKFQNACALRVSRALNYSGVSIPAVSGKTFKGADNKNYFLISANLYSFMKQTFGAGSIVLTQEDGGVNGNLFQEKLAGHTHRGIYIMQALYPGKFGALGHATLFDGADAIGGHGYYHATGGVEKITLWILR